MKYENVNYIPSNIDENKENIMIKNNEENNLIKGLLKECENIKTKNINGNNNKNNETIMNFENNYMTIRYKINKNSNYIKIFGRDFINKNKNICNIIYNNKVYKLMEYFDYNDVYKINDILEIKLLGINDITDLSYMFSNCTSLISLPDINKLNTYKFTNLSYMFNNCKNITFLPDISKWNTSNIISMEGLFKSCKSLLKLPDISQ